MVIADNLNGEDHSWIYMGEFNSRQEVVDYLLSIGVNSSYINSYTVGDGTGEGGTHWRIESNGSEGCVINNRTDGKQATAMNMYAFRVTQSDVRFTITKVLSTDNSVKISGTSSIDGSKAVYGVYTDQACTNKVGEITIGTDGTGSITLPNKQYYVKEISAPTGYELSTDVVSLKANSNVNVQEDLTSGVIRINKTAEDNIVGDREFRISWTENGAEHSQTIKTNADGTAELSGLHVYDFKTNNAISYSVSEINVDTRYETPKAQDVTLTSGNADLTVAVDFENTLKKGSIKINKQSEDGQNGDRTFTIAGGGETYTLTTANDGTAILANIPVYDSSNNAISYTISENDVPVRYVVPAEQTATLEADATVEVTFENKLKKFSAEVVKKDSENITAQGNASLAGAVYGLYRDGERLAQYTTDENGYFRTDEYPCGNYTLQELSPSQGYQLNDEIYNVGAEPENYVIETNSIALDVTENVKKGNVSIIKHSDDDDDTVENLEAGAKFEVFIKSAGGYDNAKDSERDYLITDENGYALTKDMPYGTYTVHQTKTVNDAEFVADFDVNIIENGRTYEYVLNDAPFKSYIQVTKVDAETGSIIPYEGAGFQIYNADGELVDLGTDTFYTNNEGYLITPEVLAYGDYSLVEVQAPVGYVLDSTPVPFTVSAANADEENVVNIVKVTKADTAQKGRISVTKTGEIFKSVAVASSAHENEDGELIENPTTYTPVFEESGLENAVFDIIAAEDIITPDGTVRAYAGDVVDEIITDSNGYAETAPLYLGKYEVKEVLAPYGYVLNDEVKTVELTYAGQEIDITDAVNAGFTDTHQGAEINIYKYMSQDERFRLGMNDEYEGVLFGFYANEDITAADGSVIPADGLITTVTIDEGLGKVISDRLPFAQYYVQEIATDEHYMLNGEKHLVNFQYMGQEMTTVYIDCDLFLNTLKRGSVSGKKVNEKDEPLENALFGLFRADETEFTEDTAYLTDKSDEDGNFGFDDVPYGEYIVKEIEAPTGYILSNEQYPVVIAEDGDVVEITAENKPTSIAFSKEDLYGNEIIGAELQLIDENGEIIEFWISDGENHIITNLTVGGYTLREIAAPDGYIIATDITFTIDEYGVVTVGGVTANAFTEDGIPCISMVDDATMVKISKQDITTGTELPGATLQVIDKDGNIIEEWISTTEAHYIEAKLIAGETYTLREITAPNGYKVATDITFTVNEDGTVTEIVMKDEAIPTVVTTTPSGGSTYTTVNPPTGDPGRSPLGLIMLIAGIGGLLYVSAKCRKKDKEIMAKAKDYSHLCPDFIEGDNND